MDKRATLPVSEGITGTNGYQDASDPEAARAEPRMIGATRGEIRGGAEASKKKHLDGSEVAPSSSRDNGLEKGRFAQGAVAQDLDVELGRSKGQILVYLGSNARSRPPAPAREVPDRRRPRSTTPMCGQSFGPPWSP